MSVTEVAKAGGAAWKALTVSRRNCVKHVAKLCDLIRFRNNFEKCFQDKSEWEKKAAAAKAKYEKDMAAYNGK